MEADGRSYFTTVREFANRTETSMSSRSITYQSGQTIDTINIKSIVCSICSICFLKKIMDDELIGHGIRAATGYFMGGRRMHGGDLAPAIRHVGQKMAKVSKYLQFARAGYYVGKKLVDSFSQSEKTNNMAPVNRRGRSSSGSSKGSPTPAPRYNNKRAKTGPSKSMMTTPKIQKMRGMVKRGGAQSSKSAGRFGRGTRKLQTLDYYAKQGVVYSTERGAVLKDTTQPAQSILVGHTNYTNETACIVAALALTKMALNKLGFQYENYSDVIRNNNTGTITFSLGYQLNPLAAVTVLTQICSGGDTVLTVVKFFYQALIFRTNGVTWTFLECTEQLAVIHDPPIVPQPKANSVRRYVLDMSKARISLYSKSALKLQNRTINATGNIEDSDVDNVPLYGKSYSGNGNFAYYKNTIGSVNVVVPNTFDTENVFRNPPVATAKYPLLARYNPFGDVLQEPLTKLQFSRVDAVGKAHLDPGQIKTSVLTDRRDMTLNKFLQRSFGMQNDLQINTYMGKFRFFILEKMIQAVTTTEVNGITIAVEVDTKYGCVVTAPQKAVTNYYIDSIPLQV